MKTKMRARVLILFLALGVTWKLTHDHFILPQAYYAYIYHTAYKLFRYMPSAYLDQNKVIEKSQALPPVWAEEQITEDLVPHNENLTSEKLTALFERYQSDFNKLVRFQVINGELYASPSFNPKSNCHRTMKEMFAYLCQRNLLKDVDFVLITQDFGRFDQPVHAPVPFFTFAKDSTHTHEKNLIHIPDWLNLRSWYFLFNRYKKLTYIPWQERDPVIFWRGGVTESTGGRKRLITLSKEFPDKINACYAGAAYNAPYVQIEDHLKYRYQITIDGARCAWERLIWQLGSGSVVFKESSPQTQWFYKGLKDGVHYILTPIEKETIFGHIKMLESDPARTQKLINAAQKFVAENLTVEDMYAYTAHVLNRYSEKFKGPVKRTPGMQKIS